MVRRPPRPTRPSPLFPAPPPLRPRADQGVARHHALINLVGGMSSLRALDAPRRVDGLPLLPGDPVELRGLQRIELGEAAIAYGLEHDPGWVALLPDAAAIANADRKSTRLNSSH